MSKFKITEITEWEVNRPIVQAYADHGGEDYEMAYAHASQVKSMLYTTGGKDLPFVCEAENEDEALEKYAEKYANEVVIPVKADIQNLRRFVVSLQLDCRVDIEVMAESAKEAARQAELEDIDWSKVELIETHPVNAYDVENNKLTDLY